MAERSASRINAEGMVVVPVDEVSDAYMSAIIEKYPDVVGVPRYWSVTYGYWPKPSDGWRVT